MSKVEVAEFPPLEAVWKSKKHTQKKKKKEEAHMEGHPGFIYSPCFNLLESQCLPSPPRLSPALVAWMMLQPTHLL